MQTATAPSRSRLLGSLKNSFAVSGVNTATQPVDPVHNTPSPPLAQPLSTTQVDVVQSVQSPQDVAKVLPVPEMELSNDQKMEIFESVLNEVEYSDTVPAAPSLLLNTVPTSQPAGSQSAIATPAITSTTAVTTTPLSTTTSIQTDAAAQPLVTESVAQPVMHQDQPVVTPQPTMVTPEASEPAQPQLDTVTLGQLATTLDPTQINSLNPPSPVSTPHKEAIGGSFTLEANQGSSAGVEHEPQKELSPELESYIQKVEEQDQLPQEIVIADGSVTLSPVEYPAQPVLVLPITPEIEEEAEKKNTTFSVKWLAEWCKKIIRQYLGKVVYRQE